MTEHWAHIRVLKPLMGRLTAIAEKEDRNATRRR